MNPQSASPSPKISSILKWFLISVVVFVLLILLGALRTYRPQQRFLTATSLKTSVNHGVLQNDSIYSYNGLAFHKTNYETAVQTTLSAGLRLPKPRRIYWAGDRGALMDFSASFTATEVEKSLRELGLDSTQETQKYSWYLDFASEELQLVEESVVGDGLVYYSSSKNGFYYATADGELSVYYYDITSNQKMPVAENLGLVDPTYLGECFSDQVCLIARDSNNASSARLYELGGDNTVKEIHDSRGRLFRTNDTSRFVSVELDAPKPSPAGVAYKYDIETEIESARVFNTTNNTLTDLGFQVGDTDIVAGFYSRDEFFVLDNLVASAADTDEKNYLAGRLNAGFGKKPTTIMPLQYGDGTAFTNGLTTLVSFSSNATVLVTDYNGQQLLFSTEKSLPQPTVLPQGEALTNAQSCQKEATMESLDYFDVSKSFRVYVPYDSKFYERIKDFSTCLVKTSTSGYYYDFAGVDPASGRLVTD